MRWLSPCQASFSFASPDYRRKRAAACQNPSARIDGSRRAGQSVRGQIRQLVPTCAARSVRRRAAPAGSASSPRGRRHRRSAAGASRLGHGMASGTARRPRPALDDRRGPAPSAAPAPGRAARADRRRRSAAAESRRPACGRSACPTRRRPTRPARLGPRLGSAASRRITAARSTPSARAGAAGSGRPPPARAAGSAAASARVPLEPGLQQAPRPAAELRRRLRHRRPRPRAARPPAPPRGSRAPSSQRLDLLLRDRAASSASLAPRRDRPPAPAAALGQPAAVLVDVAVEPRAPFGVESVVVREDRGGRADRGHRRQHLVQRGRQVRVVRQPVGQRLDRALQRRDAPAPAPRSARAQPGKRPGEFLGPVGLGGAAPALVRGGVAQRGDQRPPRPPRTAPPARPAAPARCRSSSLPPILRRLCSIRLR